eukprot:s2098_g3.t1
MEIRLGDERLDLVNGWFLFFFSFLCGSFTMERSESVKRIEREKNKPTNRMKRVLLCVPFNSRISLHFICN